MLRALIIDDESPARSELRALLTQFPVEVVGEATHAREAAQLIAAIGYDLIFLDIHMPGVSGLELAKQLAGLPRPPQVVFTTAYPQYAVDAFGVGAVDYLLKPFDEDRLARTFERLMLHAAAVPVGSPDGNASVGTAAAAAVASGRTAEGKVPTAPRLPVEKGEKTLLVDLSEVMYAFAQDEIIYVKLARERLRCHRFNMRELEERLAPWGFVRTHRRFLVNLARVREVNRYFKGAMGLVMDDGDRSEVPVSRALASQVRPRLGL